MTNAQMLEALAEARTLIRQVSAELNVNATACKCCGVVVRENLDDYNAGQALDACMSRLDKLVERLREGQWKGRDVVPTVDASRLRRGGE